MSMNLSGAVEHFNGTTNITINNKASKESLVAMTESRMPDTNIIVNHPIKTKLALNHR